MSLRVQHDDNVVCLAPELGHELMKRLGWTLLLDRCQDLIPHLLQRAPTKRVPVAFVDQLDFHVRDRERSSWDLAGEKLVSGHAAGRGLALDQMVADHDVEGPPTGLVDLLQQPHARCGVVFMPRVIDVAKGDHGVANPCYRCVVGLCVGAGRLTQTDDYSRYRSGHHTTVSCR